MWPSRERKSRNYFNDTVLSVTWLKNNALHLPWVQLKYRKNVKNKVFLLQLNKQQIHQ